MSKRAERRRKIEIALDEFRRAVSRALAVAGREQSRAATDHARVMTELLLRSEGIDKVMLDPAFTRVLDSRAMSDVIQQVLADRAHHFDDWTANGPSSLAGLVAEAAPGVAGAGQPTWLGTSGNADGTGPMPELWRIGTASSDSAPQRQPYPVAVPLLDASHLQVTSTYESRVAAESLVETLVLRVLSFFQPGLVQIHVWDVGKLTGSLPGLYPLTRAGLLTVHDSARPQELLAELAEHIRRVHTGVLAGGNTSVRSISGRTGRRTEPWRIAVLFGNHESLPDDQQQQLQRVARNGLACGIQLIVVDLPLTVNSPMETVTFFADNAARCSMIGPDATFVADPPLPRADVPRACAAIAQELEDRRARLSTFADLLPRNGYWTESSAAGLVTTVGFNDAQPVDVVLGDSSPHALIGGPSGSGKTNFLYALLGGLTARYSPRELELYLLDFKEGVSFAQFTPGKRDPSWLPHARLVGVNVNADREFGLALLRFLADTMRNRADIAKQHEVTKLEELRAEDPDGTWPRIVAVIDEFQYLFAERDAVASEAVRLLEDVARRGRSQGIHLVLASQDVSGIEAFWGKPAIFEQFILRVALPKARRVLAETNDAAIELPRFHAVVNHESGVRQGNQIARIPDATSRDTFYTLQHQLYQQKPDDLARPRLFDGDQVPGIASTVDFQALRAGDGPASALLGQVIDVAGSAARLNLVRAPGRNLAVIGSSPRDAASVLGAAALSVARQHEPGTAQFTLCSLVGDSDTHVERLAGALRANGHPVDVVYTDGLLGLLESLATRLGAQPKVPHYVFGYGVDAAHALLEVRDPKRPGTGLDHLRTVLRRGPEQGVHVLGWWRGVSRLKASLPIGSVDEIGSWIAFDVQGQELSSFAPGQLITWSPRAWRGLHFDRFTHARPEVVIPFDVETLEAVN